MRPASNTATMKDIASRAHVSVTTVSKVLNGHQDISEKTREHVLKVVEEAGYVPNLMAVNLRCNKGNMVGLVLSDVSKPYFAKVIYGYESTLLAAGYQTLLFNSFEQAERQLQILRQIASMYLAGVIIDPAQHSQDSKRILESMGIPYVFSNRFFESDRDYYVAADNEKASYLATNHLIARKPGHPVLCINGPDEISPTTLRYAGYCKALEDAGIAFHPEWVFNDQYGLSDAYATGRKIAETFTPPFSVFCSTDQIAVGVLRALHDAGLRVPEDAGVIGIDDIDMAPYLTPALSTVALPKEQIGEISANLLIDLMKGKPVQTPRCLLDPALVIRETT